jgi:hypothetical protein
VQVSETIENYIVALIAATRRPGDYDADLAKYVKFGASPRGTLALDRRLAGPCLACCAGYRHTGGCPTGLKRPISKGDLENAAV